MNLHQISILVCFGITLLSGCGDSASQLAQPETGKTDSSSAVRRPSADMSETEAKIFRTTVAEELVLELTPHFRLLAQRLKGETVDLSPLFCDSIEYIGIDEFDIGVISSQLKSDPNRLAVQVSWPMESQNDLVHVSAEKIWEPLIRQVQVDGPSFGILSCKFLEDEDVFHMKTSFEGAFHDQQGHCFGIKAKQTLDWIPSLDGKWKIGRWQQDEFEITGAVRSLFEDVSNEAIPNKETLELLRRSRHEELILDRTELQSRLKVADRDHPNFSDWESSYNYPSISVVDFDNDTWDDLFVLDRWGKSVLLRNNSDGTFTDVTEESGLSIEPAYANCALFFDVENDGDQDVFIGRTVEASMFFRNDGGKFVPDKEICAALSDVKFVSSAAVADINRDGLLDVYVSTYCYGTGDPMEWVPEAVAVEDALPLRLRIGRAHPYLDRAGPPNIVLLNQNGKLVHQKVDDTLKQWKNSFQAVWTDFDSDGDPDLYVCNDFAPDVFLRNDTLAGSADISFTEVNEQLMPAGSMGFGMGASVGDYNADGELDLYVSNMYSKAGNRVIEEMGGEVDPRIRVSAQGNFLLRKKGNQFEQVAGLEDHAQHVAKVGWSFGGQMVDFNNDGMLDIYVPSGFFSAPERIDSKVDL